jgi:hypothetical protein
MSRTPDGAAAAAERGDAIMQRMLDTAVAEYGAKGLVAMIVNEDNSFRYFQSGLTHAQTNNALAVGIHMNMSDHDRKAAEAAAAARGQSEERGS